MSPCVCEGGGALSYSYSNCMHVRGGAVSYKIFPGVKAEGLELSIPMPGHHTGTDREGMCLCEGGGAISYSYIVTACM